MPRTRSARKRALPPNLYERNGYYAWRDPRSRREYGLGRDRAAAITQAIEANTLLAGLQSSTRLVDRMNDSAERTIGNWAERFAARLAAKKLADNTRRTYATLLRKLIASLGESTPIARVETRHIAEMVDSELDHGRARMAQALRSFAKEFFRAAMAAGWVERNVVDVTERVSVDVKRERLSLSQWQAIYDLAGKRRLPWLQNAMLLALVSGQRREDIANATFSDFDSDGWRLQQGKTGAKLLIPNALRLNALGQSLGDVVKRCRSTGVVSRYLVHQTAPRGNSPVGSQVWIDTISKRFAEIRDAIGMGDTPPTFHEIRSLSLRMYAEQGVNAQTLAGHTDPATTAIYTDTRGSEWTRVECG